MFFYWSTLVLMLAAVLGCQVRDTTLTAGVMCEMDGRSYKVGQSVPAGDGCNTCGCSSRGRWSCTQLGCEAPDAETSCLSGGGEWAYMSDGCGDMCGKEAMLCTQAFAYACDCGPSRCWDAESQQCR